MTLTAPIPVQYEAQAPQQVEVKFPPTTDKEITEGIKNYGRELEDPDLDTNSRLAKVSTLTYLHTLANKRNL